MRGVEAVRVIDCAAIPFIPSGNSNAIALALGDKAASLVLARIDLEILLGAAEVEQDFGNGAIAFAAQAGVQRAQGKDVPLPELYGQCAKIAARPLAL